MVYVSYVFDCISLFSSLYMLAPRKKVKEKISVMLSFSLSNLNVFFGQLELAFYNRKDSLSGKLVSCGHQYCKDVNKGSVSGCYGNTSCFFSETYGDGSYSLGYFVEDVVQYDQVSGDLQTKSSNGSVIFG